MKARTALPSFVIGGAPRCGTTWLYRALECHPEVWMAKPVRPEPKFFLVDGEYRRGLGYYATRWFKDAPESSVMGEKSTNYLESPMAATRMAKDLPEIGIIFLLREPASRALSNYLWSRENGLEDESFEVALRLECQRKKTYRGDLVFSRPYAYFERGLYAQHLRVWLQLFRTEQLHIVTFEELVAHPQKVLADVQSFIGVSGRPADADGVGPVNSTQWRLRGDYATEISQLRDQYEGPNRELETLLGRPFWSLT